jgi:hypothetical protein
MICCCGGAAAGATAPGSRGKTRLEVSRLYTCSLLCQRGVL